MLTRRDLLIIGVAGSAIVVAAVLYTGATRRHESRARTLRVSQEKAAAVEKAGLEHDATAGPFTYHEMTFSVRPLFISGDPDRVVIRVFMDNRSAVRKVDYRGWSVAARSFSGLAGLTDEYGNYYRQLQPIPGEDTLGRQPEGSMRPGESLQDVLTFEPPVKAARTLYLTLPLSAIDPSQSFPTGKDLTVRIPRSMLSE